jgi:Haem-binding domain
MKTNILKITLLSLLGVFVVMQFFAVSHTNPPIIQEPRWDSPQTREYAKRACYDCHSNETAYPWYTYVAPVSWITNKHIMEGREKVNFSESTSKQEADECAETVASGEMPTKDYLLIHADARLSKVETEQFIAGLTKTFGSKSEKNAQEKQEHD